MRNKTKTRGSIYTPQHIVKMMLDYGGYTVSDSIRMKHVIDNSCGDGNFLCEIVRRYLASCSMSTSEPNQIKSEIETYIHGIEIDPEACTQCKERLSKIAKEFLITDVDWDIKCANSLEVTEYDGKMDFVFGNPPYVRTRNLATEENSEGYQKFREYSFSEKGMADLYLAFYELGLKMRNGSGILCYITPSSWIHSLSGKNMRKYIWDSHELFRVVDFESTQIFEDAQTYVMIALFDTRHHSSIQYDRYDAEEEKVKQIAMLCYDDIFINGKFFFGTTEELELIRNVENTTSTFIRVKNGYATLADDVFIDNLPELTKYTVDVIKASNGKWKKCLFPYNSDLSPISLAEIKENAEDVYQYIMSNESSLKKRTYDKTKEGYWHLIGRSQGLNDTFKKKVAISSIIKNTGDLKLNDVNSGQGVYGGMYVLTDMNAEELGKILNTDKFTGYIKSLRKYKSGGYYTFSSRDVEKYLNFIIHKGGLENVKKQNSAGTITIKKIVLSGKKSGSFS